MNDYYNATNYNEVNIWRNQKKHRTYIIKCKNCRVKFKSDYKYTERCVECEQDMFDTYFAEEE